MDRREGQVILVEQRNACLVARRIGRIELKEDRSLARPPFDNVVTVTLSDVRDPKFGMLVHLRLRMACWGAKGGSRSSTVLFHHPRSIGGNQELDAVGNALVGAYLGSLGFGRPSIVFMTEKGPDEGNLLTEETAKAAGIEAFFTGRGKHLSAR
jgi:hypothetical protein